jgi:hypothetical protein
MAIAIKNGTGEPHALQDKTRADTFNAVLQRAPRPQP